MNGDDSRIQPLEDEVRAQRQELEDLNNRLAAMSGEDGGANADQLQSRRMSSEKPNDGEVPAWDAAKKKWRPSAGVLDADLDQVDVENTTDEETIYSYTIPASTIGATGGVRLTLGGDLLKNTSGALTLKVKLGATTVHTSDAIPLADDGDRSSWKWDIYFMNSATDAQKWGGGLLIVNPAGALTFALRNINTSAGAIGAAYGPSSEDTATALALTVTATWSVASASLSFRKEIAVFERIGVSAGGGGGGASHDPLTLDANADGFFSLTDQELGVDTQAANVVVAGPAAGGAAQPTYRSLVAADIPAHDYDLHTGGVPFADLEYDDATSDPLQDDDAASDGTEDSAAHKDHVHPKHHAQSHADGDHSDSGEHTLRDGSVPFTDTVAGIDPVASIDLATKEYVDSAIHFEEDYFFNDTPSSYGGTYFKMLDTPTGAGESTFQTGSLGQGDNQEIFNFATDAGIPGVTFLEAGIYAGHIHARVTLSNKRPVKLHFGIYERANGAETLRATSEETDFLTNSNTEYVLHAVLAADVTINSTDRLIIKWFANVDSTPSSNVVVELFAEGTNASRLSVPITTDVLNQIYLRQDGTKPLLADWAVGSKKITGLTPGSASGEVVEFDQLPTETKVLHAIQFVIADEDATVEIMLPLPGQCIGEPGDMGTVTPVRFKAFNFPVGITGTMTVSLWVDDAPDFASETKIASVDIATTVQENDTTTGEGGNWASWDPTVKNFHRAKITAIHSGTAAKNVACVFYYEVTLHA